ncbi:WD40 repeat-like protein [Coniophora puteana RWD-64-598 SS2]|uniref:WD40 repeat-like protein n=1 Tax=Coniophora puteana (strain RWD-64-598) TaxID=741705 RepID=A0A5M3N785_CONPW|nr:WD40 repeat-like protein [Coniophora puteana RWD-64-598 SS2]EIW87148.1 WD40 repeat-like protein [Coniophora puteana RWD-64-598 SS2]
MKPTAQEEIDDDLAAEEENKLINEEYKTWKKNAPYLYDLVITHALDWPSLTCQWFPDRESPADKPFTTHRLLLGTHTSGQAQDYLQIATVQIPKRDGPSSDKLDRSNYDDERGELGGHTIPAQPRIQIIQKINHDGEINRARYMWQNPDLLATKAVSGEVLVFDRTKHSSEPERGGVCKPDIRLVGQTKEGYGLAWSPTKSGQILGASEDMTICHWDITSYTKAKSTIEPTTVFRGHTSVVGDVDWHATKENVFASVGDDKMLLIWDTRSAQDAMTKVQAHDREILSCAFSPASEHLLVTGSADKTIILHDLRNPTKKLHTFEAHTDEVLHLAWSPHNATIFASASSDRRVNIWDLSQIGVEQTPDDQEDGPPELLFIHGGHTARPTDFCWAPGEPENWTASTTSEDNIVMIWQPTMRIWAGDEIKVDEKELEEDAMEGVESSKDEGPSGSGSGQTTKAGSQTGNRSQSMSISATGSTAGED